MSIGRDGSDGQVAAPLPSGVPTDAAAEAVAPVHSARTVSGPAGVKAGKVDWDAVFWDLNGGEDIFSVAARYGTTVAVIHRTKGLRASIAARKASAAAGKAQRFPELHEDPAEKGAPDTVVMGGPVAAPSEVPEFVVPGAPDTASLGATDPDAPVAPATADAGVPELDAPVAPDTAADLAGDHNAFVVDDTFYRSYSILRVVRHDDSYVIKSSALLMVGELVTQMCAVLLLD